MTDTLLGIANDRDNWRLEEIGDSPTVLLWRTDGPGHFVVVSNLNGWHVGLYLGVDIGEGDPVMVCVGCGTQVPATHDGHEECPECGATGEPSTLHTPPAVQLAIPLTLDLDVDPAAVADRVEQHQRSAESIIPPDL